MSTWRTAFNAYAETERRLKWSKIYKEYKLHLKCEAQTPTKSQSSHFQNSDHGNRRHLTPLLAKSAFKKSALQAGTSITAVDLTGFKDWEHFRSADQWAAPSFASQGWNVEADFTNRRWRRRQWVSLCRSQPQRREQKRLLTEKVKKKKLLLRPKSSTSVRTVERRNISRGCCRHRFCTVFFFFFNLCEVGNYLLVNIYKFQESEVTLRNVQCLIQRIYRVACQLSIFPKASTLPNRVMMSSVSGGVWALKHMEGK